MPSTTHQWLLLWVARKMAADGFLLGGCDGQMPQGGFWNRLPQPFEIAGVRPDAWGIAPNSGELAIGEAKSAFDLMSVHTKKQLSTFGRLLQTQQRTLCRLYLAVPRSAAYALDRALVQAGLIGKTHIIRLHIPDCLIAEESYDHT